MIPKDILNYRVVRLLGSGGMGSVYLAVNTSIDQQVAIKVLRPELARNPRIRERFKQEAELLCSLDHPGIVKFLNYVETDDGVFLIMEYVKGITLEDFINKKNGLIVESKAYPMIREILDAFAYAHSKGIVHRDIKPANIIIQDDGHIKIMDFGIAQIVSDTGKSDNPVEGTPAYMSPEQVYGKDADRRSDIYSIGVLIYNMLTGKAPYDSTHLTAHDIKSRIVNDKLPRMVEYYPYISDKIQSVVDKATQKVPEARYHTCDEMKSAVKKAIAPDKISRPVLYGGIAAIAAILIGAFLIWDYHRVKVDYYRDYVEVYGVPKGIGHISSGTAARRVSSYRFETSKGKVRRVTHVNSKGHPAPHNDSETKDRLIDVVLTYTEGSDRIDTEKFMDQCGRVLYVKDFDSNLKTCTFKLDDELGTEMTLNSTTDDFESAFDNSLLTGKSKISKYILDYDEKGRLRKVEYAGYGNARVPDGQGVFGRSYVYDDKGRVIEESFLGKDGKPRTTQLGHGKKRLTYDDDYNLVQVEYLTAEGKPGRDGNNCQVLKLAYDDYGNRISERYYDSEGNPTIRKDNQTAGMLYEVNDEGQYVKNMFIGIDGEPTYYMGAAGFVTEYDENGYADKTTFVDASGKMTIYTDPMTQTAVACVEVVNNARGRAVEERLLNLEGKLIDTAGKAHTKSTYDSVGRLVKEVYYDTKGAVYAPPALGYAGISVSYNPQGRPERVTYLDAKGAPMTLPDTHICYTTATYDVRGNLTRSDNYDKEGKRVMTNDGFSSIVRDFDDNGNETSQYFLDTNEKVCAANRLYAKIEREFDEQGNIVAEHYYNPAGAAMSVDGYTGMQFKYDERNNIVSIKLEGSSKPEERRKYDSRDNITEHSYHSATGSPAVGDGGYHRVTSKYDELNNIIEERYYDAAGRAVNVKGQNYAVVKHEYDKRGNRVSTVFFNSAGNRGTDANKVHKYYNQYDPVSNKICHQISFGADGKPIVYGNYSAEGRLEYDKRGNVVKYVCYDGYGKKINGKSGWAERRCTYNDAGQQLTESYFDIEGKPVADKDGGYHKLDCQYNDMRLLDTVTLYDTKGVKTTGKSGFAIKKLKYNNQNQLTEESYYGANGRPIDVQGLIHKVVYRYRNGEEYRHEFYNTTGRLIGSETKVGKEWRVEGMAAERPQIMQEWRTFWQEAAADCPAEIAPGAVVTSVIIGSDIVTVNIELDSSAFDAVSDTEMLKTELVKYLRENSPTPSYVLIVVNLEVAGSSY